MRTLAITLICAWIASTGAVWAFDTKSYWRPVIVGKLAKYDVLGRIIAMQDDAKKRCENFEVDANELSRLLQITQGRNDEAIVAQAAILRTKNDSMTPKQIFCRQLHLDAANWSLAKLKAPTKEVRQEMKMIAALENNNCKFERQRLWWHLALPRFDAINLVYDETIADSAMEGQDWGIIDANCKELRAFGEGLEMPE